MFFNCPLCDELLFTSKLCIKCERVRQLAKIYGVDQVINVLDKCLVVQQFKQKPSESSDEE